MIPAHVIARIRETVDLRDVAKSYLRLRKAGARMISLCPFHIEKSPSFVIYPQHYYCFGCAAKGSAIDFLMHMEQLPFKDAVNYLATRYNIPVEDHPDRPTRLQKQLARVEADTCQWWWEQKYTFLEAHISAAVEEHDDEFAEALGNILLHMRSLTPAQRYAIFARQITQKERDEYAEHVRYEQFFAQSWMGLAHLDWAH